MARTAHRLRSLQRTLDTPSDSSYMQGKKAGLTERLIEELSERKGEPQWMRRKRLESFELFKKMNLPTWGPDLTQLHFDEIIYDASAGIVRTDAWGEIPEDVRRVYDRLGIPQAERNVLAGVGAQFEGDVIYHRLKEEWARQGVIFLDFDEALRTHEDLVREYFMTIVRPEDHLFSALHGAVWSGGTFLYVPPGVKVREPLQAYFRMNAPGAGQFEHTLLIVDEGAEVHYIEGCSAPKYGRIGLHAGCVEIIVKKHARVRYSSIENWSRDTMNLNTKRAVVDEGGTIRWVGGNLGAGITMLYPCSVLRGESARADHLGVAFASGEQRQDVGAKVIHAASHTQSTVVSKSVSKDGGSSVYRGTLRVLPDLHDITASITCDALLLDDHSRTETIPTLAIASDDVTIAHEASVGKLSSDDLFYLASRGIDGDAARAMIVNGFMEPIVRELPLEYAVELNRLIALEMERSVA